MPCVLVTLVQFIEIWGVKFYLLKNFQILNVLWSNFSEYFAFDIIAMFGILLDITFDILYRIFF